MTKKILLAEDDHDDQQFFFDFLRSRRDAIILPAVENGEEVMRFLDTSGDLPDVIILDQNMPKRNGLQTLSLLKQDKRFTHIPVIIYSTYYNDNLVQQSESLGALMVMTKPTDRKGYNDMIDTILSTLTIK